PVSGVSRIGLLTGCYQQRFGMQWNHDQWGVPGLSDDIIPSSHREIHTAFKEAGYATAMTGKMGIKSLQKFDEMNACSFNGANYFPNEEGVYAGVELEKGQKKAKVNNDPMWGPERKGDEYLTDRHGRHCIEFIEEHKDEPFFFYLAFTAPHTPLHAKKSDQPRVAHIESEMAKLYAAMVLSVDDNIGLIIDKLEKLKLRENTIIVLLSDNGPANPFFLTTNPTWWPENTPPHILGQRGGLNGYKGTMWEAGIRVPYIISWKGKLAEGETYTEPVSTLDIYPTLCSAARVKVPDDTHLDGVDLMPFLTGGYDDAPHKALFWFANRMGAVRMGKWKLLIDDDYHYLFDLESDRGETKSVMKENPELTHSLLKEYFNFRNQMPPYRNPFRRPIDLRSEEVRNVNAGDATVKIAR
ncbi:MAG: sulfatase-like hydrolase/transferase, partial [Rikenellaceae bacterium]